MVVRKVFKLEDVFITDGEEFDAVGLHLVAEVSDGGAEGSELACLDFDSYLPKGDQGEDEFVVVRLENLSGEARTIRVIEKIPDECVGMDVVIRRTVRSVPGIDTLQLTWPLGLRMRTSRADTRSHCGSGWHG